MKSVFIETSAINKLCDNKISVQQFAKRLKENQWRPSVGEYTVYELAKTFIKNPNKAQNLFQFLKELKPSYACTRTELYSRELEKIRKLSSIVNMLIREEDLVKLNEMIENWSNGVFDKNNLEEIIKRVETGLRENRKKWSVLGHEAEKYRNRTFEEYRDDFFAGNGLQLNKSILQQILGVKLEDQDIINLRKDINAYPAIRSSILIHLNLNFIIIKNEQQRQNSLPPAKDRFPDSLQFIEGSYCSMFLTNETEHPKHAKLINPDIKVIMIEVDKYGLVQFFHAN